MPTVKFSKETLMQILGRKISDDQLADRINFLGANCEEINAEEVTVEIFPNRPDMLSEQGLARALLSFMDIKKGFRKYTVKKSNFSVIIDKSVKNVRPYTACAIIKGLKLTDEKIKEIIQIQEKLHITYGRNRKKVAIGIYPLEHIKPPIYYKAMHPQEIRFKPLDMNKDLTGSQILAIHPTGREFAHLLEGKDKFPVFLDSKMAVMSMPPIINSNSLGKVTAATRDVFIECSGFEFDYLHTCINIIVTSLADMGGEIYSVELKYPDKRITTPHLDGTEMKIDADYVNKILGMKLSEPDIKKYLERMGYDYKNKKVIIPNYRADILHQVDLIEDIAIAYGYENFEGKLSEFSCVASERHIEVFERKLREILVGMNLIEAKNFHLSSKDNQSRLMNHNPEIIELQNSINQDYNILRSWIIPSLMETLRNNKQHSYPQNIFEIGTVFRPDKSYDTGVGETDRLAIVLCGPDANFTKIKQILDVLSEALDVKYELADTVHGSFINGRVARVTMNGSKVAYVGEIHPQVLMNWGIEMPVAALELNITELFRTMHMPESSIKGDHDGHASDKSHVKHAHAANTKILHHKSGKNSSKKSSGNKKPKASPKKRKK